MREMQLEGLPAGDRLGAIEVHIRHERGNIGARTGWPKRDRMESKEATAAYWQAKAAYWQATAAYWKAEANGETDAFEKARAARQAQGPEPSGCGPDCPLETDCPCYQAGMEEQREPPGA